MYKIKKKENKEKNFLYLKNLYPPSKIKLELLLLNITAANLNQLRLHIDHIKKNLNSKVVTYDYSFQLPL